jgi:hypothetical protein
MDLNDAIAELQGKGDWFADEFEDFDERLRSPLATILNAAASGQLLPLETCNARVAAMVEEAAADCDRMAGEIADAVLTGLPEQARIREGMESAFTKAAARIRTLVTADHTAALDAMISRARADGMREALNIANMNAWRHQGEDAHSKGMDAGARHQSQVIHDAITAALAEPPAAIRANAGEG